MRSSDTYHVQPTSAGKNVGSQMERELITTILEKIENFKTATYKQAEKSDELMDSTELELQGQSRLIEELLYGLEKGFEHVKASLRGAPLLLHDQRMDDEFLYDDSLSTLSEDEMNHNEQWPTNAELLTKIMDKLAELEKYTADRSDKFLKRIESVQTDVEKQKEKLRNMDNFVEKEFQEVRDLVREGSTTKKDEYNEDEYNEDEHDEDEDEQDEDEQDEDEHDEDEPLVSTGVI